MAVALAVCVAPVEAGQRAAVNPDAYANAIEDYRHGRALTEAVMTLQPWTRKDFEIAVDRLIAARNLSQLEAAAVFELELGLGVMSVSPDGAQIHFALGERLLKAMTPSPDELRINPTRLEELHSLWSTWFGVAGSGYLWITDTRRAWPWIKKAIQLAPHSSALRTIEGAANEIDAAGFNPKFSYSLAQKGRAAMEQTRHLTLAESAFRHAVEADARNPQAHIRFGRIAFLLGRMAQAQEELERGLTLAKNPADVYLAALFLGAVKEKQRDLAGARESYARALTISPRSQTVIVAIAYLDLISGRPDRAQALARAFAAAPADDHVWWTYRNGGVDQDGLARLRSRVGR